LFDRVCQEITQIKGELTSGSSHNNPILINQIQPRPTNNQSNQRGKQPQTQAKPQTFGTKALSNALAYQGTSPTPTQMAERGSNCNYCNRDGHWASTCQTLTRDIQSGKLQIGQASATQNDNPDKVRIRAIDTNVTNNKTVLIDLGASACVSGDSPFFKLESRLTKPIPVLLAS
jgi:hypothetical protein